MLAIVVMTLRRPTLLLATLASAACTHRDAPVAHDDLPARPSATVPARVLFRDAATGPTADQIRKLLADAKAEMAADARLPTNELFALPDARLTGQLWRRLEAKEEAHPLSVAELAIVCVMNLDAEVDNGGFSQFFFNSSGRHAGETVEALQHVGLPEIAHLYERALNAFPGIPDRDTGVRRKQMRSVSKETEEVWSDLDSAYFKVDVDVNAAVARFARERMKDIAP